MFEFLRTYLCCGCNERVKRNDAAFIYKNSCICHNCFSEFEPFSETALFESIKSVDFVAPVFNYSGKYREIFLKFKFYSDFSAGHLLGQAIKASFNQRENFKDCDLIVPVPISRKRMRERGYNQSDILADYLSDVLGIPVCKALVRKRHSLPQSKKYGVGRIANVKGAFESVESLFGKRIILFDDVYTTGSTMNECAKKLKESGAQSVCAISGAYVYKEYKDKRIHRF